jgi:hypothetical protein
LHHAAEINSLPAALEKVSQATQERKVMSKKTFFRRIAISAVVSLGFGLLSNVPSQAVVASHTLTIDSATDAIEVNETATAVLTHSFVNLTIADSVTISAVVTSSNASSAGNIAMRITDSYTNLTDNATSTNSPNYNVGSGVGAVAGDSSTNLLASGNRSDTSRTSFFVHGTTVGAGRPIGSKISVDLYNVQAAGTYTVNFYTQVSNDGVAALSGTNTPQVTWTITVTEPSRAAAAASSVTLRTGSVAATANTATFYAGTAEGTDSGTVAAATASTLDVTEEFSLVVKQKSSGSTNTARESYTVTVSGEAFVTAGNDVNGGPVTVSSRPITASGGVKSVRMATHAVETVTVVRLWSTGTAGTATVTVTTDSGLVLGTKTLTFHGTIAGLEKVATYKTVIQSGVTTGSTSVIALKVVDSAGRGVTGQTITGVSSNTAAISVGSCTDNVSYAGVATNTSTRDGTYFCDLTQAVGAASGATATITWRVLKYLATDEYWTQTQDVKMGGAYSTFTITTDKATYEPGENMIITVTAKDASGNTPYDLQGGPTLNVNKAIGGTCTIGSFVNGVATSSGRDSTGAVVDDKRCFAPAASGKFIITGQDAQAVPATVTATATVGDDVATAAASAATDAALEAIDAANAATDAANLAAEAADAATVAAEEARDAADAATAAVEALATEVATLMAALKAQITTLANTVAKIAKKVKA